MGGGWEGGATAWGWAVALRRPGRHQTGLFPKTFLPGRLGSTPSREGLAEEAGDSCGQGRAALVHAPRSTTYDTQNVRRYHVLRRRARRQGARRIPHVAPLARRGTRATSAGRIELSRRCFVKNNPALRACRLVRTTTSFAGADGIVFPRSLFPVSRSSAPPAAWPATSSAPPPPSSARATA